MQSDLVTRVLLGTIVVCLLLLLAQRGLDSGDGEEHHYQLQFQNMRKGVMLLRIDTVTGVVWRKPMTTEGPWVIVDEQTRDQYHGASEPSPEDEAAD